MSASPPSIAERTLAWCLGSAPARDHIVGDLREEYVGVLETRGPLIARVWYWREVVGIGVRYLGRRHAPDSGHAPGSATGGTGPHRARDFAGGLLRALRVFRTSPGYAIAVVLTLALGLGANAAMFGAVDRVLLSPPEHVKEHEDLRFLTVSGLGSRSLNAPMAYSFPDYLSLENLPALAGTAAFQSRLWVTIGSGPDATRGPMQNVTAELFPLLGVTPALGRFFDTEDDRAGAAPVAVLSHAFWDRYFGRDPAVLGRTVTLGLHTYEVIGVAPKGFTGANLDAVDVWVPLRMNVPLGANWDVLESRGARWFRVVVRLAEGVSDGEAEIQMTSAHLAGITAALEAGEDLNENENGGAIHAGAFMTALGPTADGDTSNTLWLAGVSLLVLLIASANVANLMLARGIDRRRDRAVRLAFGLGRGRLIWEALAESLVLAAVGGFAAVAVANWGGRALYGLLLAGIPVPDSFVNLRLFVFLAVVVALAALLAGLFPALQALRTAPGEALRSAGRGSTDRRGRVRELLTIGQVGLSTVLLVGAGLYMQSFRNALEVDLGFDHESLVSVGFETAAGVDADRRDELYREAARVLEAMPGVERAVLSSSSRTLYGIDEMSDLVASRIDSVGRLPEGGPYWYSGTDGFVEAAGLRVVQGRAFVSTEYAAGGPPALMVSRSFAEGAWPGLDPLQECVQLREGTLVVDGPEPCRPVVGVYEDIKRSITDRISRSVTWPIDENEKARGILVRASGDPQEIVVPIRERMAALSGDVRFVSVAPMPSRVAAMRGSWRVGATLFTLFGALALLVASLGLYSVLAFGVARRRREIGIRAALGARRHDLVGMVVRRAVWMLWAGLVVGIALAIFAGRFMDAVLFGVPAVSPVVFLVVGATLCASGVLAAWLPARRATAIDPATAMAAE